MQLPAAVALILQGAILFFMLGGELFTRYRLRLEWRPAESKALGPPSLEPGKEGGS